MTATGPRGGLVSLGRGGDERFTPVELLLAAVGGCSAIDFTTALDRRGHILSDLEMEVTAEEAEDERLEHIEVRYLVPARAGIDDAELDVARRLTEEVLCTVSRTLSHGCRVDHVLVPLPEPETDVESEGP